MPADFRREPHLRRFGGEPEIFDETVPTLLDPPLHAMPGPVEDKDTPPVTVGLTFLLPMALALVPPAVPPPMIGGPLGVPPDPIIPAGPDHPASPQLTPPDVSDDSTNEEAIPPTLVHDRVPQRPAPNELIPRQTERAIRAKERSNQLNCGFLRSSLHPAAGSSSSSRPEPIQTTKRQKILDSCERSRQHFPSSTQSLGI